MLVLSCCWCLDGAVLACGAILFGTTRWGLVIVLQAAACLHHCMRNQEEVDELIRTAHPGHLVLSSTEPHVAVCTAQVVARLMHRHLYTAWAAWRSFVEDRTEVRTAAHALPL